MQSSNSKAARICKWASDHDGVDVARSTAGTRNPLTSAIHDFWNSATQVGAHLEVSIVGAGDASTPLAGAGAGTAPPDFLDGVVDRLLVRTNTLMTELAKLGYARKDWRRMQRRALTASRKGNTQTALEKAGRLYRSIMRDKCAFVVCRMHRTTLGTLHHPMMGMPTNTDASARAYRRAHREKAMKVAQFYGGSTL